MGAFLKISKSFVNNKTYLFAIVIICISSFLLVSAFLLFSDYTTSYTDAQNRELYGSYDINIENIDKAQINTLKKKFSVENISEYSIEFSQKETGTTFYIYPDDKFLSMYSLTLTDGKMPQSDKEILCEPWLLYNNGISADNMLGAEITLDGTKYTVSGLIVKNSILEDTSHNAYVICYNNRQPNCILIDVENNVETVYKELSNKYKHSSEIFVSKNIDIELLNENKSFLSDGIILLLIIIVVFSSAVSVWNCVNVFIQKNVKNISIYNLLGIRKFKVLISMSAIIFVCILIANILACLIFALFSKTMISFLNELNFDTLLSFSYSVPIIKYILLSFILTIIESISLLVSVYKVNNMDSYSASINYHLIESKKPSSKPLQYVFWRIASNNFRLSRKRNIFASVSVILSAVTIISVWYMLDNINAENVNYGDISFVVEFSANDIITNDTIKEKTYEKLRANYITETRNICASQIRIPTHNLTDDFKNLLSTSPDYYAAFNNKLNTSVYIPVNILSVDQLNIKKYQLQDFEAVVYTQMLNTEIDMYTNIKNGDILNCRTSYNENSELKIKHIEKVVDFNLYTTTKMAIILVNENTFRNLSGNSIADKFYIKGNVSEQELIKLIGSNNVVKIQNIRDEKQNLELVKNNIEMIKYLMAFMFSVGIITIGINVAITMYIKNMFFAKEYAVLSAIGIKTSRILRIIFYETIRLIIPVILFSGIFSCFSTMIIKQNIQNNSSMYSYPVEIFLLCSVGIIIVFLLCIIPTIITLIKRTVHSNINRAT